jgi:hypothetical protein
VPGRKDIGRSTAADVKNSFDDDEQYGEQAGERQDRDNTPSVLIRSQDGLRPKEVCFAKSVAFEAGKVSPSQNHIIRACGRNSSQGKAARRPMLESVLQGNVVSKSFSKSALAPVVPW